ncbi:MAG: type II toxin-antitoxin system PemK/MazF family toxin [Alkalibacterium sp.]|nr:MAG: type II toxin-antitoxin system PemK/MazF family toxin [Alkalibacterium sp.]
MKGYTPKQGDIVWINFNPSAGREIRKKRPALVISSDAYNASTGFIQVCPITSTDRTKKGFIELSDEHNVKGSINAMQIKGFDFLSKERAVTYIEKATGAELGMAAQIVSSIFSFDDLMGE